MDLEVEKDIPQPSNHYILFTKVLARLTKLGALAGRCKQAICKVFGKLRPASWSSEKFKEYMKILLEIVRETWLDNLISLMVGGLGFGLEFAPPILPRHIPELGNQTIEWAYPNVRESPHTIAPIILSIFTPMIVFTLAQVKIRSIADLNMATLGCGWAVAVATLAAVLLKLVIPSFAPNFWDVCRPRPHSETKYLHCNARDLTSLRSAMSSFPSGEAAACFAGFGFLFIWANGKLKIWSDHHAQLWKFLVVILPLLLATFLSAIPIALHKYHGRDALGGAFIGVLAAFAAYRNTFAAVWDWRHNHVPLHRETHYDYVTRKLAAIPEIPLPNEEIKEVANAVGGVVDEELGLGSGSGITPGNTASLVAKDQK